MHGFDHGDDVIDWGFRQDAMAEIENMAVPAVGAPQNFRHSAFDFSRRCEQRNRIEVALHRDIMTDRCPTFVEVDAPIQADDVAAGGANMF